MWISTYFTLNYVGATGLFPIIKIRLVEDGSLVASGTMSELGDGFYRYDFPYYDRTLDYMISCDAVTLPSAERYKASANGEYGNIINDVKIMDDNTEIRALLIRQILTNRLELEDGAVENWKLYDDEDSDVLLSWDVTDKVDDAIFQQSLFDASRSKGH